MYKIKNILLLSMVIFSSVRRVFFESKEYVQWYVFKQPDLPNGLQVAWQVYFYTIALNFLILAYCFRYPFGVSTWVKKFVFYMAFLDVVHLVLFAGRNYEFLKLILCMLLLVGSYYVKVKWQKPNIF